MRRWASIGVACAISLYASQSFAAPERYALLIGHNTGSKDEPELRYAEADAAKLYEVLGDLGGFRAENMVLLRGQDASSARRALIALNERIRTRIADPSVEPMLFVYYSGHSDATAMHLGGTELELAEVEQLVRGSSAHFRMFVLDACRSGALTRVKGGERVPAFELQNEEKLGGEGVVFLTSTSANEDAQESDELKGSFFTHYFVSGLVGAADANGDGMVGLKEAYTFAYDQTLKASSRTFIGTQHPTFNYEVRGQGDLVMTSLVGVNATRATFSAPAGRTYLVMQANSDGPVVAEIGAADRRRTISVKPGKYFVRSRGPDHLLEGELSVVASELVDLSKARLLRIDYARLVRKGGAEDALAHGPQVGYRFRSVLKQRESTPCQGVYVGWSFELEWISLMPRVNACQSERITGTGENRAEEVGGELRLVKAFDFPYVSFETGVGLGASWLRQTAPDATDPLRDSTALMATAGWGVTFDVFEGFYLSAEFGGALYGYLIEHEAGGAMSPTLQLVGYGGAGLGKRW